MFDSFVFLATHVFLLLAKLSGWVEVIMSHCDRDHIFYVLVLIFQVVQASVYIGSHLSVTWIIHSLV